MNHCPHVQLGGTYVTGSLLPNGIKYTDRGEVRLSVRVAGPRLEIIVADTGIGIPAALTDDRFRPVIGRPS